MTERCDEGKRLWREAVVANTARKRAAAWVYWQAHWQQCEQCTAHRIEEWRAAEKLPPVPHEQTPELSE